MERFMPGQGGWIYQGRQYHMWFGHGTKPQDGPLDSKNKDDLGSLDQRIRTLGLTAIAGLPHPKRNHTAASFDGPALERLVHTMGTWVGGLALDHASFAARFFGRQANSPVVEHLRRSVMFVAGASNLSQMRAASDEFAAGMIAVGLDGWQRFLADAHERAAVAAVLQPVKDTVQPSYSAPYNPLGVFVSGSPENKAFTRDTGRALRDLGGTFNNQSQDNPAEPPVSNATPGRKTRGRTTQWDKPGGMAEADRDFDAKHPENIQILPTGGRVGRLPDGRTIVVRPTSSDGQPTLEIQDGPKRIKVRYGS